MFGGESEEEGWKVGLTAAAGLEDGLSRIGKKEEGEEEEEEEEEEEDATRL